MADIVEMLYGAQPIRPEMMFCTSVVATPRYEYRTTAPNMALDCGCGAKRWLRDREYPVCAYCGREPEVVKS